MSNAFTTKFKKNNMTSCLIYIQSIMDNLRACYWNMGSGNEQGAWERTGGPESWTVPPPWKLYFNPWVHVDPQGQKCPECQANLLSLQVLYPAVHRGSRFFCWGRVHSIVDWNPDDLFWLSSFSLYEIPPKPSKFNAAIKNVTPPLRGGALSPSAVHLQLTPINSDPPQFFLFLALGCASALTASLATPMLLLQPLCSHKSTGLCHFQTKKTKIFLQTPLLLEPQNPKIKLCIWVHPQRKFWLRLCYYVEYR